MAYTTAFMVINQKSCQGHELTDKFIGTGWLMVTMTTSANLK